MLIEQSAKNEKTVNLLIVEDNQGDLKLYEQYLAQDEEKNYVVTPAANAEEGLKKFTSQDFDCIFLDYMLPDIDGLDLLGYLRKTHHENAKKPVILLTGQGDERIAAEAIRMGVQNYLIKGDMNTQTMHEAIQHALRKPPIDDVVSNEADIVYDALSEPYHPAMQDAVTHVVSKALFHDRLLHTLLNAKRNKDVFGVLIVELSNYSHITGSLGEGAGFAMLQEAAKRLQKVLRTSDTLARLDENKFGIILNRMHAQEDVFIVFERIAAMNGRSFAYDKHKQYMNVAVGGSVFPHHGGEVGMLLERADMASHYARSGIGYALADLVQ